MKFLFVILILIFDALIAYALRDSHKTVNVNYLLQIAFFSVFLFAEVLALSPLLKRWNQIK